MFDKPILFIDHATFIGGAEKSLIPIAKAVGRDNTVVTFGYSEFTQLLAHEQIKYTVPKGAASLANIRRGDVLSLLLAVPRLIWVVVQICLMTRSYSIVYANTYKGSLVACLVRLFTLKRVVIHVRDIFDRNHFSAFNLLLVKFLFSWFPSAIVCNSQATRAALVKLRIPSKNMSVIYNGFEIPTESPLDYATKQSTLPPSLRNKKVIFGVFSRISEWKGQLDFIRAIARFDVDAVGLLVVGGCQKQDLEYLSAIKSYLKKESLENVALTGHVEKVTELMSAVDIVVLPSTEPEPFGRVVVEAMALGKAVAGTNMGGVKEIIDEGVNGFLLEPCENSYIAFIQKVMDNPGLASSVASAAVQTAVSKFALNDRLQELNELLAQLGPARPAK